MVNGVDEPFCDVRMELIFAECEECATLLDRIVSGLFSDCDLNGDGCVRCAGSCGRFALVE